MSYATWHAVRLSVFGIFTFKKQRRFLSFVTGSSNLLLLIRYPFLTVAAPLRLLFSIYRYFKCNEIISSYYKK